MDPDRQRLLQEHQNGNLQQLAQRSLVIKLSEVMDEVDRIPKSGRNNFHGYDYATEADVAAAVRGGMAKRHLMLVPSVEKTEWSKLKTKNGEQDLCTLTVRFTMHDGDTGETLSYVVLGQGSDTGDKATYKAMTGAEKYALMKIFLIPTGDDPERDDPVPPPPQNRPIRRDEDPRPEPPPEIESGSQGDGGMPEPDSLRGVPPAQRPPPIVFRFGLKKGETSHTVTDKDLAWYAKCAREAVEDKTKARFAEANKRELSALRAEMEWRGTRVD